MNRLFAVTHAMRSEVMKTPLDMRTDIAAARPRVCPANSALMTCASGALELDARTTDLPQARTTVKSYVHEHCTWADDFSVQLVASELLTNAVRHAGGWWHLKVRGGRKKLVLEVADHEPRLPEPREPDLCEGGGLGLHMIASLSSAFEVRQTVGGKILRVVWQGR